MGLDELRNDLARTDRELLELVARRQRLATEIGRVKRAASLPTRDFDQEKEVLLRARAIADELGIPPGTAEELVLLLVRSALTVQEKDQVAAGAGGSGKRVLIIGGDGKMGGWMVRFLASQGFEVEVADPVGARGPTRAHRRYSDWRECDVDHDVVVVAAPLGESNRILLDLATIRPRGLVFDIGSLKSPLRSGLTALVDAGVEVASVHPMFGPDTELLSGRHVIFVDLGVEAANEEVRALFAPTMAKQVSLDLESHDRLIAYVLGLSHAVNIAFFTALADSGEAAPQLAQLSSTTFDAQLDVARNVAGESPDLYFEIQSLNDYGTESLSALLLAVERLRSVVRAGDEQGFAALMGRGRAYLHSRETDAPSAP